MESRYTTGGNVGALYQVARGEELTGEVHGIHGEPIPPGWYTPTLIGESGGPLGWPHSGVEAGDLLYFNGAAALGRFDRVRRVEFDKVVTLRHWTARVSSEPAALGHGRFVLRETGIEARVNGESEVEGFHVYDDALLAFSGRVFMAGRHLWINLMQVTVSRWNISGGHVVSSATATAALARPLQFYERALSGDVMGRPAYYAIYPVVTGDGTTMVVASVSVQAVKDEQAMAEVERMSPTWERAVPGLCSFHIEAAEAGLGLSFTFQQSEGDWEEVRDAMTRAGYVQVGSVEVDGQDDADELWRLNRRNRAKA